MGLGTSCQRCRSGDWACNMCHRCRKCVEYKVGPGWSAYDPVPCMDCRTEHGVELDSWRCELCGCGSAGTLVAPCAGCRQLKTCRACLLGHLNNLHACWKSALCAACSEDKLAKAKRCQQTGTVLCSECTGRCHQCSRSVHVRNLHRCCGQEWCTECYCSHQECLVCRAVPSSFPPLLQFAQCAVCLRHHCPRHIGKDNCRGCSAIRPKCSACHLRVGSGRGSCSHADIGWACPRHEQTCALAQPGDDDPPRKRSGLQGRDPPATGLQSLCCRHVSRFDVCCAAPGCSHATTVLACLSHDATDRARATRCIRALSDRERITLPPGQQQQHSAQPLFLCAHHRPRCCHCKEEFFCPAQTAGQCQVCRGIVLETRRLLGNDVASVVADYAALESLFGSTQAFARV